LAQRRPSVSPPRRKNSGSVDSDGSGEEEGVKVNESKKPSFMDKLKKMMGGK
jgi:hypothetical protein